MITSGALRCPTGKRRYRTFTTAKAVLRQVKRRRRPGPQDPVRQYRCATCGEWHLSSTKEKSAG